MRFPLLLPTLLWVTLLAPCAAGAQHLGTQQNPAQLFDQAVAAQSRGDYPAAIRAYRQFLAAQPKSVEAHANLGAALAHTGQFDEAVTQYQAALRLLPAGSDAAANVQMNLALAYFKKSDMAHAREQLTQLYAEHPGDARIATLLGEADNRLDDSAAAVSLMAPLAAANHDNLDFDFVYGSALIRHGERREGVALVEEVAEKGHGADAYLLAGSTLLALNEFVRARKELEAAYALTPAQPGLASLLGQARDETGDSDAAQPAFHEALREDPNDFNANLYLGAILYKQRKLAEARGYLAKALAINPASSMARYEDARLKNADGKYDAAVAELEKLVADDPKWLDPHVELAALYYKLHKPEQGAKERAIVEQLTAAQEADGPRRE